MKIGDVADEPAIHFVGLWRIDVLGPQAGLDIRNRDPVIEGSQCPGESGGGVALPGRSSTATGRATAVS